MEQTNDSGQPASLMQTNVNEVVVRGNESSHVVSCNYTSEHQSLMIAISTLRLTNNERNLNICFLLPSFLHCPRYRNK